jgi:hypothetical protein
MEAEQAEGIEMFQSHYGAIATKGILSC